MRVCAHPGCPELYPDRNTYCAAHRRAADKRRGTRQARGYNADHDKLRAHWQARIDAGDVVICWRPGCGTRLTGRAWHLGHLEDRTRYGGPECIPCNLSHAGKAAHH